MSDRSFRRRFDDARERVARLNRAEVDAHRLEGPGSETPLRNIQKKFRRVSGSRIRSQAEKSQLGLGLWLIAWATCVGIATAVVLAKFG